MGIEILIFVVGIVGGFVGALVGGGGLISVPALMLLGILPQAAVATNRLGTIGYNISAIAKYWKENKINWKQAMLLTAVGLPGTYLGILILVKIDSDLLTRITGITILLLLPLFLLKSKLADIQKDIPRSHSVIGSILSFFISIYGSLVGAGTGILSRFNLMLLFKMKAIESNATDILIGFISSIFGLWLLLTSGLINWLFGLLLLGGMLIGGWAGAHTAIKKGDEFVKIAFVVVTLVMGIKLTVF